MPLAFIFVTSLREGSLWNEKIDIEKNSVLHCIACQNMYRMSTCMRNFVSNATIYNVSLLLLFFVKATKVRRFNKLFLFATQIRFF